MRTNIRLIGPARDWLRGHSFWAVVLVVAALKLLGSPVPAHAIEPGNGLKMTGDVLSLDNPVTKANGGFGADISSGVTANYVFAAPNGSSGAGSFRALVDDDVPNTVTASNYLPLAGGTLTGQLVADNLGIEFEESDTNSTCSTGNFNVFADASENKLKKCENGVATDLDTTGAAAVVSLGGFTTTTSIDLDSGGVAAMFVSPMGGSYFADEDKATVPFDAFTISDFRCKASATLGVDVTAEIAKGTCGSAITFDCQAGDLCVTIATTAATTVDTSTLAVSDGECVAVKLVTAGNPASAVFGCSWTLTR